VNFQTGDKVRFGKDGYLYTVVPPFVDGDLVTPLPIGSTIGKVRRCFEGGGKWNVDIAFVDGSHAIGDADNYRRVDVIDAVSGLA
jgi:hypothetical protein